LQLELSSTAMVRVPGIPCSVDRTAQAHGHPATARLHAASISCRPSRLHALTSWLFIRSR
jgi:hypothetical protein